VVVGLPGLVLALLARLTLREPPRGHSDGAAPPDRPPPIGAVVARIASTPTFRHVTAGFVLTNLAANGVAQFAPSYFVRSFGLGLAEVGLIYGVVSGASGVVGMLAGGFGTDFMGRRDVRWYGWGPAIGALLACPVYLLAFSRGGPFSTAAFIFVGAFLYSLYFAPTMAIIQNLVEPRMRATASALMLLMINIVGQGVGPTIMGLMSDLMAQGLFAMGDYKALCPGGVAAHGAAPVLAQACIHASAAGLQRAILASTAFFVWGAVHYLLAARHMKRDLAPTAAH
jgi:MFS family permease